MIPSAQKNRALAGREKRAGYIEQLMAGAFTPT